MPLLMGLLAVVLIILAMSFAVFKFETHIGTKACREKAGLMEVPYSYSFTTKCMIRVNNKWIPIRSYRALD
jgi:hypothetical protein